MSTQDQKCRQQTVVDSSHQRETTRARTNLYGFWWLLPDLCGPTFSVMLVGASRTGTPEQAFYSKMVFNSLLRCGMGSVSLVARNQMQPSLGLVQFVLWFSCGRIPNRSDPRTLNARPVCTATLPAVPVHY